MSKFWTRVRRALQARPLALAIATIPVALAAVFFTFAVAPAAAQSTTPPCSTLIVGTRFTLPAMTAGQEATVPAVANSTALCVEGMESAESLALKLKGESPYTAEGNSTALTVDADFATNLALSDSSYNGSLLKAAPALPDVTVVAVTELSDGVTIWVGSPRASVVAPVLVDQWQDVRIPGSLGELRAGTTKWSGNGVTVKVTTGAAFTANGTAVMNEPGKTALFDFYVDGSTQLVLAGTVPGQRFYLAVDPDSVTTDNWLQRRVDPVAATLGVTAQQGINEAGQCFVSTTCSGSPVACDPASTKIKCTAGDTLSVWGAPVSSPRPLWLPTMLRRTAP